MHKNSRPVIYLIRVALIAAIYLATTLIFLPMSFGMVQIRISEALTVLPYRFKEAILGITIGCFIANLFSPFGPIDWVLGTFLTLLAAIITYFLGKKKVKKYLVPIPTILINCFGIGFYIVALSSINTKLGLIEAFKFSFEHFYFQAYFIGVLTVGLGEAISTYALGLPLLNAVERRFKNEN